MTKKRSIHELIEEQEPEAKQRMWEEVRQRIAQEDILGEAPTRQEIFLEKIRYHCCVVCFGIGY